MDKYPVKLLVDKERKIKPRTTFLERKVNLLKNTINYNFTHFLKMEFLGGTKKL